MKATPPPHDEGPRAAARFIEAIADGQCHSDLSDKINELGRALALETKTRNAASSGELALKLHFKLEPNGVTTVGYDITTKMPKPRNGTSIFWVTKGGNFVTENPRQPQLPGIREVPRQPDEVRSISVNEEPPRNV